MLMGVVGVVNHILHTLNSLAPLSRSCCDLQRCRHHAGALGKDISLMVCRQQVIKHNQVNTMDKNCFWYIANINKMDACNAYRITSYRLDSSFR